MPLFGLEEFLASFTSQRSCWIYGPQRSYKTALAFRLAWELMTDKQLGYRYFVSNVPSVWNDDLAQIKLRVDEVSQEARFLDTVFVLDEGGKFIRREKEAQDFLGFSGKQNCCWLFPSEDPPHKSLCKMKIQKRINFHRVGVPMVLYSWKYENGDTKAHGKIWWWKPEEIFGIYSSGLGAVDDDGILDWISEKREAVVRTRNKSTKLQGVPVMVSIGGGQADISDVIQEKVDEAISGGSE